MVPTAGGERAPGTVRRVTALAWLVRDGEVLASIEIPHGRRGRARGLLGRDGIDGALLLRPCRHVHSVGMRFAIDVAFCDRAGVVLRTCTLRPWRLSPLVWRAASVVEAEAGAFARWGVAAGQHLEVRP
jgi:uncharacterized membrane protein (UPF0127 family)